MSLFVRFAIVFAIVFVLGIIIFRTPELDPTQLFLKPKNLEHIGPGLIDGEATAQGEGVFIVGDKDVPDPFSFDLKEPSSLQKDLSFAIKYPKKLPSGAKLEGAFIQAQNIKKPPWDNIMLVYSTSSGVLLIFQGVVPLPEQEAISSNLEINEQTAQKQVLKSRQSGKIILRGIMWRERPVTYVVGGKLPFSELIPVAKSFEN